MLLLLSISAMFIPFKYLKKGWILISILLLFTFISNLFFQHGKIIYKTGPLYITEEGITHASIRTFRILFMITGVKILTATTEITDLIKAVERLFKPLEKIGVPVNEFFNITILTFKSLPVIKEKIFQLYCESKKVESNSNILNKIQNISSILINFFINSIKYPEELLKQSNNMKVKSDEKN